MSAADCLGLNLACTRLRGSTAVMQMVFGMSGTSVSMYLRFGRRLLISILKSHTDAALVIPSSEKIKEYQAVIEERHPKLKGVWCSMDGLKLYLEQASDNIIQNMFYNGWTHHHYSSAVLVFCPDGSIPIASYNVPGSFHDSMIAEFGGIYKKLNHVYDKYGGMCVVDAAFSRKKYPYLIKSSQRDPESVFIEDFIVNDQATSMRQTAEWGMRALKASFPRLKDTIRYEVRGERKLIWRFILLLYNLRVKHVGINQIKNTYMPFLERNANQHFVTPLLNDDE